MTAGFEVVCEIEPPVRPDLAGVARQVSAARPFTSDFLVPDNHLGRATVSSLVVAGEVQRLGGRPIACLNARDRNLLGLHRDVLTAGALDVRRVLCVHGDPPTRGTRAPDLTVRAMLDEIREAGADQIEVGVAAQAGAMPQWKRNADFVFLQVSFATDDVLRWRDATSLSVPVYAGVLVLRSAKTAQAIPGLEVPGSVISAVEADPLHGVEVACRAIERIRAHGGFAGVYLVPLGRQRALAARLASA